MTTPYEQLKAKTPHDVLAAFEDSYRPPPFKNGTCGRCGLYVGDPEVHLVFHKSQAEQRWVVSAAIVNRPGAWVLET